MISLRELAMANKTNSGSGLRDASFSIGRSGQSPDVLASYLAEEEVNFSPHQDGETGQIKPNVQANRGAQWSIALIEISEMPEVNS